MTEAIITKEEMENLSPEGLVGHVLKLEAEADDFSAKAKVLNEQAKGIRIMIMEKLKLAGLSSATHESGYRATIRTTETVIVQDESELMKSLKKNKLVIFITSVAKQIIPAHEEVNMDQLKSWIKSGTEAQKNLLSGIEITTKEALVIAKK